MSDAVWCTLRYGLSSGLPREKNQYRDVASAFIYLTDTLQVPPNRVILYGMSIGSSPTVHLAAKLSRRAARAQRKQQRATGHAGDDSSGGSSRVKSGDSVENTSAAGSSAEPLESSDGPGGTALNLNRLPAAVVLHAPVASGIRVLRPGCRHTICCDPFQNLHKVHRITVPTLVVHGEMDEVVPISHGCMLHAALPNPAEPLWLPHAYHNNIMAFKSYYKRLRSFLEELETTTSTVVKSEVSL